MRPSTICWSCLKWRRPFSSTDSSTGYLVLRRVSSGILLASLSGSARILSASLCTCADISRRSILLPARPRSVRSIARCLAGSELSGASSPIQAFAFGSILSLLGKVVLSKAALGALFAHAPMGFLPRRIGTTLVFSSILRRDFGGDQIRSCVSSSYSWKTMEWRSPVSG
jgi:hypothetical protein